DPAREDALLKAKVPMFDDAIARALESVPGIREAMPNASQVCALAGNPTSEEIEFFVRMLFSCLVDADRLDTARHFREEDTAPPAGPTLEEMRGNLLADQMLLQAQEPGRMVNRVRREIYRACVAAAAEPMGLFRLTAPTGGGKTRSSLAFALQHAIR